MTTASQTSLRLPEEINARLNTLAQRTGRSKTFYILEAIKEHLDDLEDFYEAQQVPGCIPDNQKGSEDIVSLLALPPEANLDFEIPPRSREMARPVDLS